MRFSLPFFFFAALALQAAPPGPAGPSIIENGSFDDPVDPLKGWIVDYAFTGNSNYIGNKSHVSIATEGVRKNVVQFGSAGDAGVKMECRSFVLERGFKYTCTLDIKGGGYRIYFAGYQFAPGVRPHESPDLGELRMIYQSKAAVGSSAEWKQEKLELPGVTLSQQAIDHLKKVRYLTVYIWMAKPGCVDNVNIVKTADPAMNF
ncbi:MAG: hypothetical protein DVB28_000102 [Verrucomicrobia bacterium]|nr:MAG: hypothetical protein DVB28_000102 [Verrucomicrobiota bacterium]